MARAEWTDLLLEQADDEDWVWEVFHENSKTTRYGHYMPDAQVAENMVRMTESFAYDGYPMVELPAPFSDLEASLGTTITSRSTPAGIEPIDLTLEQLSTLLYAGYGVTRSNEDTQFLRPFRTAPSGGALYPLEIYLSTKHVDGLDAGLYHYSAADHALRGLRKGDLSSKVAEVLVEFQADLAFDASLMLMVTAAFGRTTFKYGARGYRFVMLEAGHVAQNINLAATAYDLGCFNIGGFYDRQADAFLGLDGITQGTVYMMAIGGPRDAEPIEHDTNQSGSTF